MPYSYPEIKTFRGLFLQQNSFTVPDGALEKAENAQIAKDNVVSKRRGFYRYYDTAAPLVLNSLHVYKGVLFALCTDKLLRFADGGTAPNETGTASQNTGATVACTTQTGRSAEANDNLYLTSDNGIMKIESSTGSVYSAGIPPALDITGRFVDQNGAVDGDSIIYYRVLFGRRDANKNLLLGAPSDYLSLTNLNVTGKSWSRTTNVTTVTSLAHNMSTGMYVDISGSTGGHAVAAGNYQITVTSADAFTIVDADTDDTGTLTYKATRAPRIECTIPSEVDSTDYFCQLYRTSCSNGDDASPYIDFKLVTEYKITSSDLTRKTLIFVDTLPFDFLGAELYTNPNSREGESQANARPPYAKDICVFKNHMIFSNVITRHTFSLDLITSAAATITAGDYVVITRGATVRRYVARSGVGNETVQAVCAISAGKLRVTYTSHGLAVGDVVYIGAMNGNLSAGEMTVSAIDGGGAWFELGAMVATTTTSCEFRALRNISGYGLFQITAPTTSVSAAVRKTSLALVKAINQDATSVVYARYVSSPDEIPGKMQFQAKGFGAAFTLTANTTLAGSAFNPPLPSSGVTVTSTNDIMPNAIYVAKIGEPDAVPFQNYFPIGSRSKAILRAIPLRDSLILVKEDGVYRMDGDTTTNFVSTILDNTVFCVSENSVCSINNQVALLSNQGVCLVSSTAVQIVSRDIEDPMTAVLGTSTLSAQTAAIAYESERLYVMSTLMPGKTTSDASYVLNTLSNGWTTWSQTLKHGVIGPKDTMFIINGDGDILRERKNHNRIDYCGQNYAATVVSVASDKLSAVITTSATPEIGDILVKSDAFSRIVSVAASGTNWNVGFRRQTALAPSDSAILYDSYTTTIKLAPFHAGSVGRNKQFAQMQMHLRDNSVTNLTIYFSNETFGGSDTIFWESHLVSDSSGWGMFPWGLASWGNPDGISENYETSPAPVIRTYPPITHQRGTYIQPVIQHDNAGESIKLQSISFAVRGYGERTSK